MKRAGKSIPRRYSTEEEDVIASGGSGGSGGIAANAITLGGHYPDEFEMDLGVPVSDGMGLVSTSAGVRSWVSLLALGETSTTAHRGDHGKTAYDHSQATTGTPHGSAYAVPNADTTGSAGSLKSPSTTGLMQATGMGTGATRVKTVRDSDDTILELGGSYSPSGKWAWTGTEACTGAGTGVLQNAGGMYCAGQIWTDGAVVVSKTTDLIAQVSAVSGSNGANNAKATFTATNDAGASAQCSVFGSGRTATIFGRTIGSWAAILGGNANLTGLMIGCQSVNKPIIFGINTSEVAQFSGGTLSTDYLKLFYTADNTADNTGAFQVLGGGYFAKNLRVGATLTAVAGVFSSSLTAPTLPPGTNTTGVATMAAMLASLPTAAGDGYTTTFLHDGTKTIYIKDWQGVYKLWTTSRANLAVRTAMLGGDSTNAPTGWTNNTIGSATLEPTTSTLYTGDGATAWTATCTADTGRRYNQLNTSISASTSYVVSCFLEAVTGSVTAAMAMAIFNLPSGATAAYQVCEANPAGTSTGVVNAGRMSMLITVAGTAGSFNLRLGIGCNSSATVSGMAVRYCRPQVETNAENVATRYIYTDAASASNTDYATTGGKATLSPAPLATSLLLGVAPQADLPTNKACITPDGGFAIRLIAGETLSRGNVVYSKITSGADGKVWKNPVNGDMPIGVVYADASADTEVLVVTSGIAYVLPTSSVTAARGYIIYSSGTEAGSVDQANSVPAALTHWTECGHFLDTGASAGSLTRASLHFN